MTNAGRRGVDDRRGRRGRAADRLGRLARASRRRGRAARRPPRPRRAVRARVGGGRAGAGLEATVGGSAALDATTPARGSPRMARTPAGRRRTPGHRAARSPASARPATRCADDVDAGACAARARPGRAARCCSAGWPRSGRRASRLAIVTRGAGRARRRRAARSDASRRSGASSAPRRPSTPAASCSSTPTTATCRGPRSRPTAPSSSRSAAEASMCRGWPPVAGSGRPRRSTPTARCSSPAARARSVRCSPATWSSAAPASSLLVSRRGPEAPGADELVALLAEHGCEATSGGLRRRRPRRAGARLVDLDRRA